MANNPASIVIFFNTNICLSARLSVQGPRCRYAIGRILSEGEDKADEKLLQRCEDLGFNVFSFPEAAHVVTTSLPRRTVFSVPVGVRRVYPKLEHYIKVPTDHLLTAAAAFCRPCLLHSDTNIFTVSSCSCFKVTFVTSVFQNVLSSGIKACLNDQYLTLIIDIICTSES